MTPEEEHAYAVLAKRFGFSPAYIRLVLEQHFESPSEAGRAYESDHAHEPTEEEYSSSAPWTLDEIRKTLEHIDRLRQVGEIPPLRRMISIDRFKTGKRGKLRYASDEELQQELALQEESSIDPDGNLVVNGQIVKYGWLQSFEKHEYE